MSEGGGRRTWLERLAQAVSGEPQDRQELIELRGVSKALGQAKPQPLINALQ